MSVAGRSGRYFGFRGRRGFRAFKSGLREASGNSYIR